MNWTSPRKVILFSCLTILLLVSGLASFAYVRFIRDADERVANEVFSRVTLLGNDADVDRRAEQLAANFPSAANSSTIVVLSDPAKPTKTPRVTPDFSPSAGMNGLHARVSGEDAIGLWLPLSKQRGLFIGELTGPAYANVYFMVGSIIASGCVATVFLIVCGIFIERNLYRQISDITLRFRAVGLGALDTRFEENTASSELSEIARHANSMLIKLEAMVSDARVLSNTLAHDLRNYIVHAQHKIRRIKDFQKPEDINMQAESALASLRLLDRVAIEVARLSVRQANMSRSNNSLCDLSTIAVQSAQLFAESFEDAAMKVELELNQSLADVNSALVMEISNNLLSNALKYGVGGGYVSIRTYHNDDNAILEIADHGVGIPVEERDNVFQLNVRLARDAPLEGDGCGLAIVKLMAKINGGGVELRSTREGSEMPGAKFVVYFPKADPKPSIV